MKSSDIYKVLQAKAEQAEARPSEHLIESETVAHGEVIAGRFVLVGASGDRRAVLDVVDDCPTLRFFGHGGQTLLVMGLDNTDSPILTFYDHEGNARVCAWVNRAGYAGVSMWHKGHDVSQLLCQSPDGHAGIYLYSGDVIEGSQLSLSAAPSGLVAAKLKGSSSQLQVTDAHDRVVFQATAPVDNVSTTLGDVDGALFEPAARQTAQS